MKALRPFWLSLFITLLAAQPSLGDAANSVSESIDWAPLIKQSFMFLGIQHSFRIATEPDTRAGLGGPFFKGWAQSVGSLHGWADGDPFFVNYIGHPMEGAVAGFIFVQNDPLYRRVEFGRNRDYWRSRLRAAAWSWAYSEQFEIGPLSEATFGKVQAQFPQHGFADHVITPSLGLAWIVAEDAMDKYVIRGIEARTGNKTARALARSFLNPSRSMANAMRGEYPWYRDTREGVGRYVAPKPEAPNEMPDYPAIRSIDRYRNERDYAPFELAVQYNYSQLGRIGCNGGGASALFNFNAHLGVETEVSGCKMLAPAQNVSGDSTVYLAGPRYTFRDLGNWTPWVHALAGGEKLTSETFFPDKKPPQTPGISKLAGYERHALYTSDSEAGTVALQFGGGVDYTINRALAFRVAGLEYLRTWAPEFSGANPRNNIRFETGLVLRMGNW